MPTSYTSAYRLELLSDEPIAIWTGLEGWSWDEHFSAYAIEMTNLLDNVGEPIFFIGDFTQMPINIQEMVLCTNYVTRNLNYNLMHHRNLKKFIGVTQNAVIRLAIEGIGEESFACVPTMVTPSMDIALTYCRLARTDSWSGLFARSKNGRQ